MSFSAELEPGGGSDDATLPEAPVSASRVGSVAAADFGTRFSAWMIDALLLFGVQWIVVIALSRQLQAAGMVSAEPCVADSAFLCEGPNTALWALLFFVVFGSTLGYHAWFDGVLGATPGKRWMRLRVVDGASLRDVGATRAPVGFMRGLLRAVIRQGVWLWVFLFVDASPIALDPPSIVWFLLLGLSLATLVWGSFAPSGRAWHDLAVDSLVVDHTTDDRDPPLPASTDPDQDLP